MSGPGRQLDIDVGVTNEPMLLSGGCGKPKAKCEIDTGLNVDARSIEVENMLTGLVAIGMTRWNAMASLVGSGMASMEEFNVFEGIDISNIHEYDSDAHAVQEARLIYFNHEYEADGRAAASKFFSMYLLVNNSYDICISVSDTNNPYGGSVRPIWGDRTECEKWFTNFDVPPGTEINGDLIIIDSRIEKLSDGMTVRGSLNVAGCHLLDEWPLGLKVGHNGIRPWNSGINMRECYKITKIPDDFNEINGIDNEISLCMNNCISLTYIPEGLSLGSASFSGCSSLEVIPKNVKVVDDLYAAGCENLKILSSGITVGKGLHIGGCKSLVEIGEGVKIGGSLSASNCSSLKRLPAGLKIPGDLDLSYCTSLVSLPSGLNVGENKEFGGDLNMCGCTSWDGIIPIDAKINGLIYTDKYGGISLEEWRLACPNGEFKPIGRLKRFVESL